jgi:hypothetical protein
VKKYKIKQEVVVFNKIEISGSSTKKSVKESNIFQKSNFQTLNYCLVTTIALSSFMALNLCRGSENTANEKLSVKQLRQMRRTMAKKTRRVIFNNDGCDAYKFPKNRPATPAGLIAIRTPAVDSHVDTMSYCTLSSSFGMFSHRTKVGEFISKDRPGQPGFNFARLLAKQGTDPLQVRVNWARANNKEIFWSMRMNDCHDSGHTARKPYFRWSKLKANHPEYLLAPSNRRLPHCRWSAVDYTHPEIRELAFRYFEEVCRNYDIDGIELDFFRHLYLFKSVAYGARASQKELNMLTDLIKRIRVMTEKEGLRRGRPILIAIRVPDSVEYCKGVGIDLERWLSEGLVDMVIGSGYFQLNPWEYLVKLGHKYKVQVYAGLSEPRIYGQGKLKRRRQADYRARAMDAWQAGVDGIYVFNEYNASKSYLSEIGEPEYLNTLDKLYFTTYRNGNVKHSLVDGDAYLHLPRLTPKRPAIVMTDLPIEIPIRVGDDLKVAVAAGYIPKISCKVWMPNYEKKYNLKIRFNQQLIPNFRYNDPYLVFKVAPKDVRRGKNTVRFDLSDTMRTGQPVASEKWTEYRIFDDKKVLKWPHDRPFWKWPRPRSTTITEINNKSLHLVDKGIKAGEMNMMLHPWQVKPDGEIVVEAMIKVDSSTAPLAVAMRIADGRKVEYLTLSEKNIGLRFAGLSYAMNTTDKFHLYRIEIAGKDLRVYVDGKLRLNAAGKFITPVTNKDSMIGIKLASYLTAANKCGIGFGSFSGPGRSSARCKFIRYNSPLLVIRDLALEIKYTRKKETK